MRETIEKYICIIPLIKCKMHHFSQKKFKQIKISRREFCEAGRYNKIQVRSVDIVSTGSSSFLLKRLVLVFVKAHI